MSFRQVPSQRQHSFKLRQRRDRTFFEAMEGCAENERLTVRPVFTYSPPVVAVRFGHLYKGDEDKHVVEGLVWKSILTQLPHQLIAMDPQRLGTVTAAYDLHFQEGFCSESGTQPVTAMLPSDVLNEPLFFNRQISWPAASSATTNAACPAAAFLTPQQKPLMLSAGITKVAHLRLSLQRQQPQMLASELSSVLLALPPAWRTIVSSAPASTWFQVLSASGRHLIQDVQTGQLHTINPHLQLQQAPPEPVSNPSPVQVISWDPSRPWRGPAHQPAQLGSPLYLQGQLWGPHHLSLGVWGWGSQPAHQLVVRQAGLRLRLIRSFATKHPLAPSGLTCRPRVLPMPTSGQSVAETLQAMELRWVGSMQPNSRGTARLSSEMSASLPAWMTPSQTPRRHWAATASGAASTTYAAAGSNFQLAARAVRSPLATLRSL